MPTYPSDHSVFTDEARLLVHDSNGRPTTFPLDPARPNVIGRSLDCQLRLEDSGCSRQHCIIEYRDHRWIVRDLGSRNGTLVNGDRIKQHLLVEGDVIAISNTWLVFALAEGQSPRDAAAEDTHAIDDTTPGISTPQPVREPAAPAVTGKRKRSRGGADSDEDTAGHPDPADEDELIGDSAVLAAVMQQVKNVAATDTTVLVRGESGVGKELVARAIHRQSRRAGGRFLSVNCAALTESLLESELFGHERGSFTGAYEQKKGKFEQSHRGTLLLDEIGEMSPSIQAKFLRVLEGHPFERVGGQTPVQVDVRVIAATNTDLEVAVRRGLFRPDLYFRLNVLAIEVPPLRNRTADIPALANYFLDRFAARAHRKPPKLTDAALKRLKQYDWPGNIRELRNMLERAVVLHPSQQIDEPDLQFAGLNLPSDEQSYEGMSLEAVELQHILRTLRATRWNKSKASKILGIERSTLDRKLKRNEVNRPDRD
jgi:DNA-binding NtrC family response regulator